MKLNINRIREWDLSQLKEFNILWFKTQNNYETKLILYKKYLAGRKLLI